MEQIQLFRQVVEILERLGIQYMVVGSIASSTYGEPRMTRDIDIVIKVREDEALALCREFPPNEFYLSEDAVSAAVRHRGQFNIVHPESGNKVDFMIARDDPWGREQLSNRQRAFLPDGSSWYVARPEDIVIGKLIYFQEGGSDRHLRDIASMFRVGAARIDRTYIDRWAKSLGVEEEWRAAQTYFAP